MDDIFAVVDAERNKTYAQAKPAHKDAKSTNGDPGEEPILIPGLSMDTLMTMWACYRCRLISKLRQDGNWYPAPGGGGW